MKFLLIFIHETPLYAAISKSSESITSLLLDNEKIDVNKKSISNEILFSYIISNFLFRITFQNILFY